MTNQKLEWLDGVGGGLKVPDQTEPLSNLPAVLKFSKERCGLLTGEELTFLGALSFFVALRDYARDARMSLLDHAERALDSFDPVLGDFSKDVAFQQGLAGLKDHLFKYRSESYHELVK